MKKTQPHKRTLAMLAFVASAILGLGTASAQVTLNLGSDGSYGAINIPASSGTTTLNVPSNGVFNCTSITIGQSSTLRFVKNALNTPVYLLATGDVLIEGIIDVSGESASGILGGAGGPGGFDGGNGGFPGVPNGDGHGPGGGVDTGAVADRTGGNSYMTPLLIPMIGGSGGSGGDNRLVPASGHGGGGGGGGGIVVASNTKIEMACSGSIRSNPGSRSGNGGSAARGAVRLVAPVIEEVTCSSGANSGTSIVAGTVRFDAIDKTGILDISVSGLTGGSSIGTALFVFPPTVPTLRLTSVAGNAVPPGSDSVFVLPAGSSTNQNVVVEAMDFDGPSLDIDVQVVPENGAATVYQATINLAASNPASITVPVTIPVNVGTRICVWTRRP